MAGNPAGAAGAPPWADRLFTELAWHAKHALRVRPRSARGYVLGPQPVACRAAFVNHGGQSITRRPRRDEEPRLDHHIYTRKVQPEEPRPNCAPGTADPSPCPDSAHGPRPRTLRPRWRAGARGCVEATPRDGPSPAAEQYTPATTRPPAQPTPGSRRPLVVALRRGIAISSSQAVVRHRLLMVQDRI